MIISENLFGSQVKKKSRQSKRQFESKRRQGKLLWKFGQGFATYAFKPCPCFRQKPFISLPYSRPECTANIQPMFRVSGTERHPVVSPAAIFLSRHAILPPPNNGSRVIWAPQYLVNQHIGWWCQLIFAWGVHKLHKIPTRHPARPRNCIPCLRLKTQYSVQLQTPV